jgi:hypothetical protein
MLAWRARIGQELRVDVVRDRERWVTVGVVVGVVDGTAAFVWTRVGERPTWPVLRRECHRLFPEEMFAA